MFSGIKKQIRPGIVRIKACDAIWPTGPTPPDPEFIVFCKPHKLGCETFNYPCDKDWKIAVRWFQQFYTRSCATGKVVRFNGKHLIQVRNYKTGELVAEYDNERRIEE